MDVSKNVKDKKIAVIGAGACGIFSLASLKEEGFEPVCFEASDRHGGLWNYREESVVGFGSLMSTTVINHSKELGSLSNFPPSKTSNNYMRHHELFQYITDYYTHHELQKYVRFNHEVIHVKKAKDYESTGRFFVAVKDKMSGKISEDIFDGVVVATGHFNYPKIEKLPGMENFKGEIMHTHSLKTFEKFSGKRVLVVGAGCSGLDAVEQISNVASQVYLSARSGMIPFSRVGPSGYPIDFILMRRYNSLLLQYLPISLCSWYFETFFSDPKFSKFLYYVNPKYHILAKDPMINDAIFTRLLSGSCIYRGPVKHFTEEGVVFDGEENATQVDFVIMATGYTFKFPFLEEGLLEVNDGRIELYKCVYPAQLPHPTLAFIGFLNPFGPGTPCAEIQCRWTARVFAGKRKLPATEKMREEIANRHEKNMKRYAPSEYMTVRVDVMAYTDEIASEIGCKPNVLKYLFTDFPLFLKLLFGPSVSYQYRLEGPHKWEGAREAIMTCEERVLGPLLKENRMQKSFLQRIFEYIGNLIPRNIFIK